MWPVPLPAQGTRDGRLWPRAGNCRWRAPGAVWAPRGLAVRGDAGASAGARREQGPSVPEQGSAIPRWLIVLGCRWGSGGAGRRGPVGRSPRRRRLLFLRVMFLFLIPFAFSPALPPSSISSASVTSSVASELHGAVMEPDILLNKRVFFLWKPGCLLCALLLPYVVF